MGSTGEPPVDGTSDTFCADLERWDAKVSDPGRSLAAGEAAVYDGYLTELQVRELQGCALARRTLGEFEPARIGAGATLARREDIRGDSICWLGEPLRPAERDLIARLEDLRARLNREALLGLVELELHYAWYPAGAHYDRHLDQPRERAERCVSLVLYLNEGWTALDGGALRIFGAGGSWRDIKPLGGRLVLFLSHEREHAVLTTRRERLAVAGWFRTRA